MPGHLQPLPGEPPPAAPPPGAPPHWHPDLRGRLRAPPRPRPQPPGLLRALHDRQRAGAPHPPHQP
uniref:Uncharacterized protein n=1 Tax=Arcella intermedia TaxID=1963864 RepID=A0A6B2LVT9_9EUKA